MILVILSAAGGASVMFGVLALMGYKRPCVACEAVADAERRGEAILGLLYARDMDPSAVGGCGDPDCESCGPQAARGARGRGN
jgi:hypothetical protein